MHLCSEEISLFWDTYQQAYTQLDSMRSAFFREFKHNISECAAKEQTLVESNTDLRKTVLNLEFEIGRLKKQIKVMGAND